MPTEPIQPLLFRHPVSAGSHLLFCLWAVYATVLMYHLGRDSTRRAGLVFGLSLVLLYASSAAYHAVPADRPALLEFFHRLDLSMIHVLIAGTCTPLVVLLTGRLRAVLLLLVWGVACAGVLARWLLPLPPYSLGLALYIASALLGLAPLALLGRVIGPTGLAWLLGGGVVYAAGGLCQALRWPVVWPGVIGPHEVLHLCDMGGSAAHLVFVMRYVLAGTSVTAPPVTRSA
jgi:hemolysin III